MTKAPSSYSTRDPDVFSRGSLNFTYELLSEINVELADSIRNIIESAPLPKSPQLEDEEDADESSDHFKVMLDPLQIRAILQALFLHDEENQDTQNICQAIMGKALIEDWMKLAYQMIAELPEEQRSSTMH